MIKFSPVLIYVKGVKMACKYFGVRTSRAVCKTNCPKCAVRFDCTLQTNILLATSIEVGDNGDTLQILPAGKVSGDTLLEEV